MKVIIKNRKQQNMVVVMDETDNATGLVFIMHGLGGNKDQPQILSFAQTFKEKRFTTIRFDTTNTHGESDGKYEDATITNYSEDLEDVIAWAKKQRWYQEPFYLVGHSLGGISTALYAQRHPHEIKGLAPLSTVISGKLRAEIQGKEAMEQWEKIGWREERRTSKPNEIKRLKWNHMVDNLKYDLLPNADKLTMSVLMIVGDKDELTPAKHQHLLYDKLPGDKEMHLINGAAHTFVEPEHLAEIKRIFIQWIEKLQQQ